MVLNTAWCDLLLALYRYGNTVDSEAATLWSFVLALAYNIFSIMYRALPQGALIAYSAMVHQHYE